MRDPDRAGTNTSGWCLTRDHNHCRWTRCDCHCHMKDAEGA